MSEILQPLARQDLIKAGVAMFKQSCYEATRRKNNNGQWWWTGRTCQGGGAYTKHRMNEDTMTPVAVAHEVGHVSAKRAIKLIREAADMKANLAVMKICDVMPDEED